MINKLNFVYNEPAQLGSGFMATRGLRDAFERIGVLHYAFNTTGKEFLKEEELRRYPVFYIRGFLEGRKPLIDAAGDQFKATLQSESYFTRHGVRDPSSRMIREREGLLDLMFTIAETDINLYKIPTYWIPSWADTTVLDDIAPPEIDKLGFIGGLPGREDWFKQCNKSLIVHKQTELSLDPFINAKRYTEMICKFKILVAPPGRFFNSMTGRVFEIMACRRLCLAYLNEDTMFEHIKLFKDGEDLVYWKTVEEMEDKYVYYSNHPEEAHRIAENGYRKVRELHNQDVRARYIANIVFEHANKRAGIVK